MNHYRKLSSLVAVSLAFAATLFLGAPPASAQSSLVSFNVTNCLGPTNYVVGWPTNVVTTNGLGQGTGGPVNVANQEWAGFDFQAYCATNVGTAGSIIVQLIRSCAQNPPAVAYGTNNLSNNTTNLLSSDWETITNGLPALVTISVPINTTNYIHWFTNLDRYAIGGATWIGISSITNSATNCFLTNITVSLNKKIIPIRYP